MGYWCIYVQDFFAPILSSQCNNADIGSEEISSEHLGMTWKQLPFKVKILISLIAAAAFPIAAWAFWHLYSFPPEADWWILLILTLMTIPAVLVLPSNTMFGIGDTFIMASAMLYGPAPCIITSLLHTSAATYLVPGRPKVYFYKVIFNSSNMICGALLYSSVYFALNSPNLNDPARNTDPRVMLIPAAALTLTFFLFNSIVTSLAIAWAQRDKPFQFWIKNCGLHAIDFTISAVAAVVIVGSAHLWRWAPLCAAPIIGLIYTWNKTYQKKERDAKKHLEELEGYHFRFVETLALAVDAKDQTTYGHIRRVKAYALGLAKQYGITQGNELKAIEYGALLHDIGKLAIKDYILNKPGSFTKPEFDEIKRHTIVGDELLQQVQFPFPVAKNVRSHHERWDGTGYPDGLRGEEIPIGARILAIADAFDSIRNSRPYKLEMSLKESVERVLSQRGLYYDPQLVDLFISHVDEFDELALDAAKNLTELSFRSNPPSPSPLAVQAIPEIVSGESELEQIFEFCSANARSLPLQDALFIIFRRLKKLLHFDTCLVFAYKQDDDLIEAIFSDGQDSESLLGLKMGRGERISGYVTAYKLSMLNANPALEFQGLPSRPTELVDALVVPLIDADAVCGTISLYAKKPSTFSQSHLALLQMISEQVAPLIRAYCTGWDATSSSTIDPVTGLHLPTYLFVKGRQVIANAEKCAEPLSLLYLEVTNFRQKIALFGPGSAESILRRVAEILRSELRQTDILVRFGEFGFVALLPGVAAPLATRCLTRWIQMIKCSPVFLSPGNASFISCQAVVSSYPEDGTSLPNVLQSAQKKLQALQTSATSQAAAPEGNVFEFPPRI